MEVFVNNKDKENQQIVFLSGYKELSFESKDDDGDVEINLDASDSIEIHAIYLNQENIKLLISHLQKQLINS